MKKEQEKRTYRPHLSAEDEIKVKYLHQQGLNPRQISFISGRSLTSVYKILNIRGKSPNPIRKLEEKDIDPNETTPRSE